MAAARINGNVTFGAGNDSVDMNSGILAGTLNQGDGADRLTISAGQITGAVSQGNGVDDFNMTGGTLQSLAQGDSRDTFLMTGGTIVGAFEDGDTARMTGGTIGRVDMKLDNNLFDLSGGQILGNLVTGFGTDTIIVSGGRIGGNVSVSGGNDSITVTGGEIVGEIRASAGDDTLLWDGGGIIRSAILMGEDNDSATLRNLERKHPRPDPEHRRRQRQRPADLRSGPPRPAADRYINWETVNLNNGSRLDLDGTLRLGDSVSGTGVFNIDGSSTLTSAQGSITPFTAGQRATLNNAGVIDLSSGNTRTNDTLTVQGNYAGNGGQLFLQSALGDDNSASDKLVVNDGTLTGNTLITVTNLGGAGALTRAERYPVGAGPRHCYQQQRCLCTQGPGFGRCFRLPPVQGGVTAGSENSWYPAFGRCRASGDHHSQP